MRPPQVPVLPITDPNKTAITQFREEKKPKVLESKKTSILDELRKSCTSFRSDENSNIVFPSKRTDDKANEDEVEEYLGADVVRIASAVVSKQKFLD